MSNQQISVDRVAARWWHALQGNDKMPGDRAALARLRRASIQAAMAEPATLDLFRKLGFRDPARLPRVAAVAMVLAHIRESTSQPAIRQVGATSFNDDTAKLKPLRFRRLLVARSDEELAEQMRRLIALADRKANPGRLAGDMICWNDATRARWAFDYYNAGEHANDLENT